MGITITEEIKAEIKSRFAELLTPAKHNTFICDICGSGTGKNGTGITVGTKDKTFLKCWNGSCNFNQGGDIITYYQILHNIDFLTAAKELAEKLHIYIEEDKPHTRSTQANSKPLTAQTSNYTQENKRAVKSPAERESKAEDFTEFYNTCNTALNIPGNKGLEYMKKRGISLETCNKFKVGYCGSWKHPKAEHAPGTERVIIPSSSGGYLARAIENEIPKQYQKQKAGKLKIFNAAAIASDQPAVFIVEGEIDAMSIYEAGAAAVGLGSTSNIEKLLNLIDREPAAKEKTFIICGDNDENKAGEQAALKLAADLKERKIDYIIADINGSYKDANEHLQNNRAAFISHVQKEKAKALEPFESDLMSNNIDKILETFENADNNAISTGFKQLDKYLNGGIRRGELTLIGAAPSLGKTTLAMQIIENIAQNTDENILVFSLEMSKSQHFSKSISRLTWETNQNIKDKGQDYFLLQASEIMDGQAAKVGEGEPLRRALKQYRTYAGRLHIFDNNRNINYIDETVQKYIKKTGKKPIIVIDYVQLLKTDNAKASAMDVIQDTIAVLSRLKSDYNLAIVAIVAFNRDSYKDGKKVNLDSGRDTSDLEYSADTYIALNFTEWETEAPDPKHSREELMNMPERAMTAKILKQRMGNPYGKIDMIYRPHINYFEELSGNIRNISAEDLTPETAQKEERLKSDIKRLEVMHKMLESGDMKYFSTADHHRYTPDNAHRLKQVIEEMKAELAKLQPESTERRTGKKDTRL